VFKAHAKKRALTKPPTYKNEKLKLVFVPASIYPIFILVSIPFISEVSKVKGARL